MKQRIVAALFLAGFATASLAQGAAQSTPQVSSNSEFDTVTVQDANTCPAGFYASVPSYEWQNGHFVRNGWVCDSLDRQDRP